MEKDGEKFYREIAEKNKNNSGLKIIFTMLANEEAKHYGIIKAMEEGTFSPIDSSILNDINNIFEMMKTRPDALNINASQVELYRQAQDIEIQSEKFYLDMINDSERDQNKIVFGKLAEEEKKHCLLLENIIEFVDKPQMWLENAEWNHLEEY
jgi:rubrerythrin